MTKETHLPEDIIVNNILSRLPVKSLLRFKCVSKRWRILLSDPEFAKFHLKIASELKTLKRRLFMSTSACRFLSLDLETPSFGDDQDKCCSVRNLTFLLRNQLPDDLERLVPPRVLGSCNGLVCVAPDNHINFCIFNPSTGFSSKLPVPQFVSEHIDLSDDDYDLYFYGFGYVSATDDYKVVVAASVDDTAESDPIEMFSLRANSWRTIESPIGLNFRRFSGTLFKEALHWLCDLPNLPRIQQVILAFDLAKEEFRQVAMPVFKQDSKFFHGRMGVLLEGFMCACCYGGQDDIEVWVMREYDVSESWTMLYKLSINDPAQQMWASRPVFYRESGTVVLNLCKGNEFIKFESKKDSFGNEVVYSGKYVIDEETSYGDNVIEYVDSLLSFPSNISV